jgi:site-specific recombinase XerD
MLLRFLRGRFGWEPDPAALTREALLEFALSLSASSPATIERRLYAVSSFCGWLVESGALPRNPARGIPRPKRAQVVPRALPENAAQGLLLAARPLPMETCLLWLLLGTGMRRAEVAGIVLEDLDLPGKMLTVRGKGGRERSVPLSPEVGEAIVSYLPRRHPRKGSRALLLNAWGDPVTAHAVWRIVKRVAREAGLDTRQIRPHKFRTTFATTLARDKEVDIRTVQELLGHANLNTTMRYVEVSAPRKAHAVNRMAETLRV